MSDSGPQNPDETPGSHADWVEQARQAGWQPADTPPAGPEAPSPPEQPSDPTTQWTAPVPPQQGGGRSKTPGWVIALVVVAGALWWSGAADEPLSKIGLNKNPCVKNAFGATFCGENAKRLCEEFGGPGCDAAGYSDDGSLSDQIESETPAYEEPSYDYQP